MSRSEITLSRFFDLCTSGTSSRIANLIVTNDSLLRWSGQPLPSLQLDNIDLTKVPTGNSNWRENPALKRSFLYVLLLRTSRKNDVALSAPQALDLFGQSGLYAHYHGETVDAYIQIGFDRCDHTPERNPIPQYETLNETLKSLRNTNPTPLRGVTIVGGVLTFRDIERLYALGARQFSNITLKAREDVGNMKQLDGAVFDDHCQIHFGELPNIAKIYGIQFKDSFVPALDVGLELNEADGTAKNPKAFFDLLSGKNNAELERRILASPDVRTVRRRPAVYDESTALMSAQRQPTKAELDAETLATLLEILFDEHHKAKHSALKKKFAYCFDLSSYQTKIPYRFDAQLDFINQLLTIDFTECAFDNGVTLPDFILNHCAHKQFVINELQKKVSPDTLKTVLLEAKQSLEKLIQQGFDQKTVVIPTGPLSRGFSLRGCTVHDVFTVQRQKQTRFDLLDMQNTTFESTVNFCNVSLPGGKLRGAHFQAGITINNATNFLGTDPKVNWPSDMAICYVLDNGDVVDTSVADLLKKVEEKYYKLRPGGREKSTFNFRTDYFADVLHKATDKTPGEKLLSLLQHIQKQRGTFSGKQNSRTFVAMQSVLAELNESAKETRRLREARERIQSAVKDDIRVTTPFSLPTPGDSPRTPEVDQIRRERIATALEIKKYVTETGQLRIDLVLATDFQRLKVIARQCHAVSIDGDSFKTESLQPAIDNCFRVLTDAFSAFTSEDVLGSDPTYDAEKCKQRADELVAKYLFLKALSSDDDVRVLQINAHLKRIYTRYLDTVVHGIEYHNERGQQNKWLRHNCLMRMFEVCGILDHSPLNRSQADQRTHVLPPTFFSKQLPSGKAHLRSCQKAWVSTPLVDLADAGCIEAIEKDEIARKMTSTRSTPSVSEEKKRCDEKQYLIARYIEQGDIKKITLALDIFFDAGAELNPHLSVIEETLSTLRKKALEELKRGGNLSDDTFYYHRLRRITQCLTDKLAGKSNTQYITAEIERINALEPLIKDAALLTGTLKKIASTLTAKGSIVVGMLETLRAFQGRKLVWLGDNASKDAVIAGLAKDRSHPLYGPIQEQLIAIIRRMKTLDDLKNDQQPEALTQAPIDAVVSLLMCRKDLEVTFDRALSEAFRYDKIKSSARMGDRLNPTIPAEEAIENPGTNAFKYQKLVELQSLMDQQKALMQATKNPDVIRAAFHRILRKLDGLDRTDDDEKQKGILKATEEKGEKNKNFWKLIVNVIAKVKELQDKWERDVSHTLGSPPVETQLTSVIKEKIDALLRPVFAYMQHKVDTSPNLAMLTNEVSGVFGDRQLDYLSHVFTDGTAYEYVCTYDLQEAKKQFHQALNEHSTIESILDAFQTLHRVFDKVNREVVAHHSFFGSEFERHFTGAMRGFSALHGEYAESLRSESALAM